MLDIIWLYFVASAAHAPMYARAMSPDGAFAATRVAIVHVPLRVYVIYRSVCCCSHFCYSHFGVSRLMHHDVLFSSTLTPEEVHELSVLIALYSQITAFIQARFPEVASSGRFSLAGIGIYRLDAQAWNGNCLGITTCYLFLLKDCARCANFTNMNSLASQG